MTTQEIYAHGKLLLTAEYAVLDGALALAVPTVFGQKFSLETSLSDKTIVQWQSFDMNNQLWLETVYPSENPHNEAELLHRIFDYIRAESSVFEGYSYKFNSKLEFPRNWGLGSSSTLMYFLGKVFKLNPYKLNELFFKGSGYDIACAGESSPIKFMRKDGGYYLTPTQIDWSFKSNVYFAYLGKKKNSRDAINHYRNEKSSEAFINEVTSLTNSFLNTQSLKEFQKLIEQHELLLSDRLKTPTVKSLLFADLDGAVKSLGGWGGDFVMIATEWEEQRLKKYLSDKGIDILLAYNELILNA